MLAEASDRICGKRLVAIIPALLEAMERRGDLELNEAARKNVILISASSVDRMLSPARKSGGIRRRKKFSRKASKAIKIKTSHDWKDSTPGFLEIDFVVHGGGSTAGEKLHSLVATDVCSSWTEAIALISREQTLDIEGLKQIQKQMPVPVLGINSDNDSAFINDTLIEFCQEAGITFTRSRVHHKNDQAWVEQKNGTIIRKIVGHKRFSRLVAGQIMATLFQAARLYANSFQPSFKLRDRTHDGSNIKKHYHSSASPCERLLEREHVSESAKATLRAKSIELDQAELLRQIRNGQTALAAFNDGEARNPGSRKSLNEFLSEFPDLCKQGEVRETHRKSISKDRHWRTREDPFKDAWVDILLWLQENPDMTAKTVLKRLQAENPALYQESMLRTWEW
ncbi:transposase family protein [Verrucomicrobia bacterium]|nr:transposase family protein [Verrucomicrobiota bacterium]